MTLPPWFLHRVEKNIYFRVLWRLVCVLKKFCRDKQRQYKKKICYTVVFIATIKPTSEELLKRVVSFFLNQTRHTFLTFTWLKILRKKSPKFLQLFSEFGQNNNFPYTINLILSTRILFLYFQNIPKLNRQKIAWKYLTKCSKTANWNQILF